MSNNRKLRPVISKKEALAVFLSLIPFSFFVFIGFKGYLDSDGFALDMAERCNYDSVIVQLIAEDSEGVDRAYETFLASTFNDLSEEQIEGLNKWLLEFEDIESYTDQIEPLLGDNSTDHFEQLFLKQVYLDLGYEYTTNYFDQSCHAQTFRYFKENLELSRTKALGSSHTAGKR